MRTRKLTNKRGGKRKHNIGGMGSNDSYNMKSAITELDDIIKQILENDEKKMNKLRTKLRINKNSTRRSNRNTVTIKREQEEASANEILNFREKQNEKFKVYALKRGISKSGISESARGKEKANMKFEALLNALPM